MTVNYTIPQTYDLITVFVSANSQTNNLLVVSILLLILVPILFIAYKYSGSIASAGFVAGSLGAILSFFFYGAGIMTTAQPIIICIVIVIVSIFALLKSD